MQIWLSKDNIPMIMHGGDNGELNKYGYPNDYVFDWTSKDLIERLDIGEGERMPTLEMLLKEAVKRPNMLLNIELKAPADEAVAPRYNMKLAAQIVINMINEYQMTRQIMMSSFNMKVIKAVHEATEGRRDIFVQSLRNFDTGPDPADYTIDESMHGVNLIYSQLNKRSIERVRSQGS